MQDKTCQKPRVPVCYEKLVRRAVGSSEGVFLWARLVIRALLISIKRHDPIEVLAQQLESTPRDINQLYHTMFASISPADQIKAFKLFLLVANNPLDFQVNVLTITWLSDLEDPDFPMSNYFAPYTMEEMTRRHKEAEYQLSGLTKGLLESTTQRGSSNLRLFFNKGVQFFHRTVREFVLQSMPYKTFQRIFQRSLE